jgi:hypothetical protein
MFILDWLRTGVSWVLVQFHQASIIIRLLLLPGAHFLELLEKRLSEIVANFEKEKELLRFQSE